MNFASFCLMIQTNLTHEPVGIHLSHGCGTSLEQWDISANLRFVYHARLVSLLNHCHCPSWAIKCHSFKFCKQTQPNSRARSLICEQASM